MFEIDNEKRMHSFVAISAFIYDLSKDSWRGRFASPVLRIVYNNEHEALKGLGGGGVHSKW